MSFPVFFRPTAARRGAGSPFRWRLRTALIGIALIALLLGIVIELRRRSARFETLALQHGRLAHQLESSLVTPGPATASEAEAILRKVHWHDASSDAYRRAAGRPWMPDPEDVRCKCPWCLAKAGGCG